MLEDKSSLLLTNQINEKIGNFDDDFHSLLVRAYFKQTLEHVVGIVIENYLFEIGNDLLNCILYFFMAITFYFLLELF